VSLSATTWHAIPGADPLGGAPEVVVVCLDVGGSPLAAGAAIENLLIQLSADGLGARWLDAPELDPAQLREPLDLPADWTPVAVIAVGQPADEKDLAYTDAWAERDLTGRLVRR
jgi:coenzyme F420-0:L-glutamate ligase/coenzyme F420-1:gamma-L-glutamate ligase